MDVGTGSGGVSPLLVDLFDELVLVDVEPEALDQAAATIRQAAMAQGSGTQVRTALVDLSTPTTGTDADLGPLDLVYAVMALHHVFDVPQLLTTVAHLLRPGGRIVVADLEPDGGLYHADRPGFDGHDGFDREQLLGWIAAAGLEVDAYRTAYVDTIVVDGAPRRLALFVTAATRPAR